MTDLNTYCDNTYKRLTALKAGLYDVITRAGVVEDEVHGHATLQLAELVESIEAGIAELKDQCPADWSANRQDMEDKLARLSETLTRMADKAGIDLPDTTAWV